MEYVVDPLVARLNMANHGEVKAFSNGKEIDVPDDLVAGGSLGVYEILGEFHRSGAPMPNIKNKKLARLHRAFLAGVTILDGERLDLEITAGFDDQVETFVFRSVPH